MASERIEWKLAAIAADVAGYSPKTPNPALTRRSRAAGLWWAEAVSGEAEKHYVRL
jgi:hypothetical protein